MDFTLLKEVPSFNIENYFPAIIAEFKALGRDVVNGPEPAEKSGCEASI